MYTQEDLHKQQLASFIDGEGCIRLSKRTYTTTSGDVKNYFYPNVTIGMKHKKTIEHIHNIANIGEIYEHNGMYIWHVHNKDIKNFLTELLPFLLTKKDQAETVLDYFKENANPEALYWKSRFEKQVSYK